LYLLITGLALLARVKKNISPKTSAIVFDAHLVVAGAVLRAVQEILSHESITTTELYSYLNRNYLADTLLKHHPQIN
jgi:integrase/recombinase XerD